MSRVLDWTGTALAAALLLTSIGLVAWQQARVASAVQVAGRVVALDCGASPTSCSPLIEYLAPDGKRRRIQGPPPSGATTYEVNDEWLAVLVQPATGAATIRGETSLSSALAVLLALGGSILLGLASAGLVRLPGEEPSVWWLRGAAAVLGVVGSVAAYAHFGGRYVAASTTVPMAFVATACIVPALIRLGQRSYPAGFWLTLPAYGLALVALVLWLGLLGLPEPWREGVMACAPFAVAVTLPLQALLWPALEAALANREQRAKRRAHLRRELDGTDRPPGILVRIDSVDPAEDEVRLVRRDSAADTPVRASLVAFAGAFVVKGSWYMLVGPVVEKRAAPAGSGYREQAQEEWIVSALEAEPLGADLDLALRGGLVTATPAWWFFLPLLVSLLACVLGGVLLMDRTPPLSGEPIPATGLVEGLDAPLSHAGRITEVAEWPGRTVGEACRVVVEPTHRSQQTCHIEVICGGTEIYPGSGGYTRCLSSAAGAVVGEDTSMDDGDPAIRLDTRSGRVVVRARGGVSDRSVTIDLQGE